MPLSCSCDFDFCFEPGQGYYEGGSDDFTEFGGKTPEKCVSCDCQINGGDLCISFEFYRYPEDDEEAIKHGFFDLEDSMQDEAPIRDPDDYICEKCGEIYLNLESLGFECISPRENMESLLSEYQHEYSPPKLV